MFTKIELLFLERHGISNDAVLDVQGMRPVDWKALARSEGFDFVLCSPGKNCDHRIKTRANSCCQCNPSSIRHCLDYYKSGWVYLAYSGGSDLIKVGYSKNPSTRCEYLNSQGYGGSKDWNIIAKSLVPQQGVAETDVKRSFGLHPFVSEYLNRFSGEKNKELYEIDPVIAVGHFLSIVSKLGGDDTEVGFEFVRPSL